MNKASNSAPKPTSSTNPKPKKTSKDRDKRKGATAEPGPSNAPEKTAVSKEANTSRQYAGISGESICIYAEQTMFEHLSEEVCNGIAEDVNYKLRYVIHDALVRARQCGRNFITSVDVDETFQCLNLDKVYGAPTNPEWLSMPDDNLFYLNDSVVNLHEICDDECTYSQPVDVTVTRKWVPEEASASLKNYFAAVCEGVVSKDRKIRSFALEDLSKNTNIGPAIEWFYNFAYYLIGNYLYFEHLSVCASDIIVALDKNPVSYFTVSEKQLNLLVRLILPRLFTFTCSPNLLNSLCYTLGILSECVTLRDVIVNKITTNIDSFKDEYALHVLKIASALGIYGIERLVYPYMYYFLERANEERETSLVYAVLEVYNIMCREDWRSTEMYYVFHNSFGEDLIVFWKTGCVQHKVVEKQEINWLTVKSKLVKTRRRIDRNERRDVVDVKSTFEITKDLSVKRGIRFASQKKDCEPKRNTFAVHKKQTHVIVGKTSLLINEFKSRKCKIKHEKCYDHSLHAYNL